MINNRQGGRRRGRGGQRPQGMAGNTGGNARDNRQRGNAAQLLEKYKSLARDAQLAGDRVQTEYFLQYADHYFRVLEESRSRYEEQQSSRRGRGRDEDDEDEGEEMVAEDVAADEDGDDEPRQPQRRDRNRNRDQDQRAARGERFERDERPRRERAPVEAENDGDERIPLAVLPPAIGVDEGEDEAPAPRRRTRKPRADGDEIAPAA